MVKEGYKAAFSDPEVIAAILSNFAGRCRCLCRVLRPEYLRSCAAGTY